MNWINTPKVAPKYRHQRTHASFLTDLSSRYPKKEVLLNKIREELLNHFKIGKIFSSPPELTTSKKVRQSTHLIQTI